MRALVLVVVLALVAGCGSTRHAARTHSGPRPLVSHFIAPGGMAGVKLQMSPRAVRAVLGPPTQSRSRLPHHVGLVDLTYFYGRLKIDFVLGGGGQRYAYEIQTTSPAFHTLTGVGVGSTRRALRGYAPACVDARNETVCGLNGMGAAGGLSFELRHGRVFRVTVFTPPF